MTPKQVETVIEFQYCLGNDDLSLILNIYRIEQRLINVLTWGKLHFTLDTVDRRCWLVWCSPDRCNCESTNAVEEVFVKLVWYYSELLARRAPLSAPPFSSAPSLSPYLFFKYRMFRIRPYAAHANSNRMDALKWRNKLFVPC